MIKDTVVMYIENNACMQNISISWGISLQYL